MDAHDRMADRLPISREIWLVVGDDAVRRSLAEALKSLPLSIREFANAADAIADLRVEVLGCVVVSLELADLEASMLFERLDEDGPGLVPVAIAERPTVPEVVRVMRHGVIDVLELPVSPVAVKETVLEAIAISAGRKARCLAAAKIRRLDERELEAMDRFVAGESNRLVAQALGLGLRTVERLRSRALQRLGVSTIAEAAVMWRDAERRASEESG